MNERVGFIGLGIMGSRMAANLRRAGFELTVWNRTRAKADDFAARHGAQVADTPRALGAASDVVVTMVVDGEQVEGTLVGDEGAASGLRRGALCVDMSTIGPSAARWVAEALAARGIAFLDAPVTGSSPKAADGTLTIMAGGARDDFDRARPLFDAIGRVVIHAGPTGQGQWVKLLNNTVAAINTAAVAEAFVVARKAGVHHDALVQVMSAGSGASAMLDLKAGPMRAHDWETLFKLDHMLKDVRLCLQEAEAVGGGMPLAAVVRSMIQTAADMGLGERDFAALLEAVEEREGTRI
jgi:3-hydroxyisobutyrate dehydrogenase-like beta-hydroxyacid dehydrogenase